MDSLIVWTLARRCSRPVTLLGTVTAFGTSGLVLTKTTTFTPSMVLWSSLGVGIVSFFLLYFIWVRPMEYADNSTAFSIQELKGKTGEVITTLPSKGYGEVLVPIGSGHTNQIAASIDQKEIPQGTKVVIVEVKDHTLYVIPQASAGYKTVKEADQ